jgi:hypothetical protein
MTSARLSQASVGPVRNRFRWHLLKRFFAWREVARSTPMAGKGWHLWRQCYKQGERWHERVK